MGKEERGRVRVKSGSISKRRFLFYLYLFLLFSSIGASKRTSGDREKIFLFSYVKGISRFPRGSQPPEVE